MKKFKLEAFFSLEGETRGLLTNDLKAKKGGEGQLSVGERRRNEESLDSQEYNQPVEYK